MAGFQGCQTRVLNFSAAAEADAYGALLGAELALSKGCRDIVIEGDALNIINALKYRHLPFPWSIQYTVSRIRDCLPKFNSVEFRFVKKEANNVAHSLAAHAVSTHTSDVWLSSPPSCIALLLSLRVKLLLRVLLCFSDRE